MLPPGPNLVRGSTETLLKVEAATRRPLQALVVTPIMTELGMGA